MSHDAADHDDGNLTRGEKLLGDVQSVRDHGEGIEVRVFDGSGEGCGSTAGIEDDGLVGFDQPKGRRGDSGFFSLIAGILNVERVIAIVVFVQQGSAKRANQCTFPRQLPKVGAECHRRNIELFYKIFNGCASILFYKREDLPPTLICHHSRSFSGHPN